MGGDEVQVKLEVEMEVLGDDVVEIQGEEEFEVESVAQG